MRTRALICCSPIRAALLPCMKQVRYMSQKSGPLPSETESNRSQLSKWFSAKMDNLQTTVFTAGRTLNDLTGYTAIENIRKSITMRENELVSCRDEMLKARQEHIDAVARRVKSQNEVNQMLSRRELWTPVDSEQFTKVNSLDQANQVAEKQAEEHRNAKEQECEDRRAQLTKLISSRYYEEQIWSDKIRRASTWGTWGLMGFNIMLFIVVQLGLEPWKRRRLVGSFEDKVKAALDDNNLQEKVMLDAMEQKLRDQQPVESPSQEQKPLRESFPTRIAHGIETSSTFTIEPKELFSTLAVTTSLGMLLGSLITLACK